ncbi:hypothetical protein CG747_23140 [Streptomyces sp. CB02959]|nr:hypothetical protein CG747_23140 [Streptomyces sp. CB02959]
MTGVRSVLTRPLAGPAVWRGADLVANRAWALRLEPSHLQELDAAVRAVRARGTPLLKATADDFPLPTLAGELRRIADVLENGRGFALVEQLPVERYGAAAAATLLWGIGRHLGVPVSQNATGHMLGHVRDTGHPLTDPGVRGYQTRAALPFHTDESDVLALLCLRPARSGGRVSLASSAAVYNGLLAQRPRLAARPRVRAAAARAPHVADAPSTSHAAFVLLGRTARRPLRSRPRRDPPPRRHHASGRTARMTNLALCLADAARADGDRIAVRQDETALSYGLLDDASARVAALLHTIGVRPGDRVALAVPNVVHFPISYYGILRAGAVVVPLNPLLKAREFAYAFRDCGATAVLTHPQAADEVCTAAAETGTECLVSDSGTLGTLLRATDPMAEVVARSAHDTAVILYTSGTTGTPKGAELTHHNLLTNAATTAASILRLDPDDVLLGALPLFHAFGQTCALNAAVAAGATLTLIPRFAPQRALEIMSRDRVTVFLGVPTMYTSLLRSGLPDHHDFSRLRLAVSGGAALPDEALHAAERSFGVPVLEGYGLSETSPVAAFNHPDRPRKPGAIGHPVRGVEMRLLAPDGTAVGPGGIGEIAIRGENVMKGYWNRPEATAEAMRDGWFRTGDLARVDEDGYYFVVDRKKDLIIRGGYNVYPREIEELLYTHPAVAEAAVIGVPDELHGEEVAAAITLRPDAHITASELRAYLKQRLAAYKYPRIITFTDSLPKSATGKILKREIVIP